MLGYHDASAAWVAMICSDSGHYAARVEDAVARELYPHMDLLTAGFVAPVGQAHRVDGGYRVTGRWQFGSGCLHADRLIGGCLLLENGAPVLDGGNPAGPSRVLTRRSGTLQRLRGFTVWP